MRSASSWCFRRLSTLSVSSPRLRTLLYYPCTVDSTQRIALSLLEDPHLAFFSADHGMDSFVLSQRGRIDDVDGLVVVADGQSCGRGRHGRSFLSPSFVESTQEYEKEEKEQDGGPVLGCDEEIPWLITFSRAQTMERDENRFRAETMSDISCISSSSSSSLGNVYASLCFVGIEVSMAIRLMQAMSIAVCETIRSFGGHAWIKWPNDVYMGSSSKVAGMLVDASSSLRRPGSVDAVLGVGVNLNMDPSLADRRLEGIASSVASCILFETSSVQRLSPGLSNCVLIDKWLFLSRTFDRFSYWLLEASPEDLHYSYSSLNELLNKRVFVYEATSVSPSSVGSPVLIAEGNAESIDDSGTLLIRCDDGSLYEASSELLTKLATLNRYQAEESSDGKTN